MKKPLLTLLIVIIAGIATHAQTAGDKSSGTGKGSVSTVKTVGTGWPSKERKAFIKECVNTATAQLSEDVAINYCYCMQEKIETRYPNIKDAEKSLAETGLAEFEKEAEKCIKNGSLWTASGRQTFIRECIQNAKPALNDEQAKSYCECMLFKVEVKYPDPKDADKLDASALNTPEWKKKVQACIEF